MSAKIHETRPVQVWIDADLGVADIVEYLNMIPGVSTHASCQGTIGEGGQEPYGPYVEVSWRDAETLAVLKTKFDVERMGEAWGYVHPKREHAPEEEGL
jgi:hypothetical protein